MNTIKKRIFYIVFILLGFFYIENIKAQDNGNDKRAQLESQKIAFITKSLNLTVSEAQKFWPVYNEFQQKNQEIIKKRRQIFVKLKQNSRLPDDELTKMADQYIQLQLDESKLASEYHTKFKEVLSISKVIAYYRAEEQFKVWLLNQLRGKPEDPGNR